MTPEETKAKKAAYMREWYWRNHEKAKAQRRKSSAKNSKKIIAGIAEWRNRDREKFNAQRRDHYRRNKERIRENARKNYHADPELARAKNRAKRKNDQYRKMAREYAARRRETDDNYRIMSRLRARLYSLTRRRQAPKLESCLKLVGCSIDFLRGYLEARFTEGMTWKNIEIDHHIPCAEFDLRDLDQQKQCFHFSNLRPMWRADNLRKGAKLPPTHQAELL